MSHTHTSFKKKVQIIEKYIHQAEKIKIELNFRFLYKSSPNTVGFLLSCFAALLHQYDLTQISPIRRNEVWKMMQNVENSSFEELEFNDSKNNKR